MYVNEQVKNLDITGGQVPFIKILCENGEIIQNEFCRFLDMDKSTVAKMMVKLESEGYIIKTNNKTDNRSTYIKPTKKSYEIYPKLERIEQNLSLIHIYKFPYPLPQRYIHAFYKLQQ